MGHLWIYHVPRGLETGYFGRSQDLVAADENFFGDLEGYSSKPQIQTKNSLKSVTFRIMKLKQEIQRRINDFLYLCQTHKVKKLYAFGSSITDRFNEQTSDIDILVEIDDDDPIERGEKLMSFWDKLEEFFHRKVDLLTDSSIKNPILRKDIDRTKVLIYDGKGQKVLI